MKNANRFKRPDGRPEAYDIPKGVRHYCHLCLLDGHRSMLEYGKVVIMPGFNFDDGETRVVCVEKHIPDDVVIYDPRTGKCRDKSGFNEWTETSTGLKVFEK